MPAAAPAYAQQLARNITVLEAVGITVSGISPIASLYIIAPVVFAAQGSGVFWSLILAGVVCVGMAFCYAELGSSFPVAGGEYAIVARVLGRGPGFVTLFDFMVLALVGPSSVGLGAAQYLAVFRPDINQNVAGAALIVLATVVALFSVKSSALVTGAFLVVQLVAVGVMTYLGFTHVQQSPAILFSPVDLVHGANALTPVPLAAIVAGVALAITVFNGYDTPLMLSEEIAGSARNVARAIFWALAIAILITIVPVVATLLGTPSLSELAAAPNPMSYVMTALGGPVVDAVVLGAVTLALFNAGIVAIMGLGRIFFSSGRDRAWPGPINTWLTYIHPRLKTPMVAVAFIGTVGALITATTNLATIVTFASLLLVVLYASVATAALVSRFTQKMLERPYRMPLWPLPPLLTLTGCILVITQQEPSDILVVASILAVGLLYYLLYLRPRSATHWVMRDPAARDTQ